MDMLTRAEDTVKSTGRSRYAAAREAPKTDSRPTAIEQTVLVFQGGGALGAYQAGVYQALTEGGIEPDWVIGTSIGAINGTLIAGNKPGQRLARLQEFWDGSATATCSTRFGRPLSSAPRSPISAP